MVVTSGQSCITFALLKCHIKITERIPFQVKFFRDRISGTKLIDVYNYESENDKQFFAHSILSPIIR